MRLTLRTMLAYLDGILEPDDAKELGRRIEESEQATSVLHRTQDVMRRLRLGAPSLTSDAAGLDPNTVAEYLDNTLQDDRVADFEKVCLESEIHLAEVASCHQVLTLVLGEPAEIDPAARQRMYRLLDLKHAVAVEPPPPPPAEQEASSMAAATIGGNGKDHADSSHKETRHRPAVPDYLRDPPRKKRGLMAPTMALVVAACVVALGLYGAGQFEPGTPLGNLLGLEATEVADGNVPAAAPPEQDPPDIEPVESPGTPIADEPDAPAMQANPVSQLPPPPQDDLPPEPIAESPDAESPDAQPPASPLPEPVIPPDPVAQPDNGLPIAPMPESTHFPVPRVPGVEPQPNVPGVVIPEVETPDVATPDVTAPNIADVPPPAPEAVVVASVATKGQVLLRRGAQESVWQRAQFQEGLRSHARLIALPTYRPKVAMNSGTTVQLIDGTAVELLPADGQTADGMKMVYGRAILMPGPDAPSRFRLQVGDRSGVIVFADPQSAVAIEVATVRTPGTDPEALPALLVAKIYPRSGQVVWEDTPPQEQSEQALAIHPSLEIAAGQCLVINAMPAQPPVPVDAMPNWISPDATNALDSRASKMLEPALQANRSISLGLTELLDHRLQEVRWLAVRCLGHIGVFEPMVAALDDVDHKAAWPAWPLYIDQLTDALTRGPEVAAQVRQAMEKQLGEDEAAVAYRMLWGYTLNGLKEGEGQTLVDHLDHDLLAVRVLSFHNLEKATGLRLYYEPEQTAAKRRQPIRSWNDRLQSEDFWLKLSEREQEQSGGQ